MSIIDKLLQMDTNKITEMPTKEIEIKRLSEIMGEPFMVKCQAVDGERYADIQKKSIDISKKGGVRDIKVFDMQSHTILNGVIEPSLKDKNLLEHFKCVTPKELVNKLFLAGEIQDISNVIQELSGYDKSDDTDEEEEVKKQ